MFRYFIDGAELWCKEKTAKDFIKEKFETYFKKRLKEERERICEEMRKENKVNIEFHYLIDGKEVKEKDLGFIIIDGKISCFDKSKN